MLPRLQQLVGPAPRRALALALPLALALTACAAAPDRAQAPRSVGVLDGCAIQREADEVTSVRCGDLLAVEAVVLSATEQEVAAAFDEFASSFGAVRAPRRVESEYVKGDARHRSMRLEGDDRTGAPLEAQMLAVMVGSGARLVTCSARVHAAGSPSCAEVVAELVVTPAARVASSAPALESR